MNLTGEACNLPSVAVLASSLDFHSASNFANGLNWDCYLVHVEHFHNNELHITLPKITSKYNRIMIYMRNHQDANSMLMLAYLIVNKVKELFSDVCIEIIFTYIPYSRHDDMVEKFSTFHHILKLLKICGTTRVYGVDLHVNFHFVDKINKDFGDSFLCNIPISGVFNRILQKYNISAIIFPDSGAEKRLNGKILDGINTITCKKNRTGSSNISFESHFNGSIVDKNSCIVVDDVVHSCNTLSNVFTNVLRSCDLPVFCFITHLDITSAGLRCLNSLQVRKLYTTNSVEGGVGAVKVPHEVLAIEDILLDYFLVNNL